MPNRRLGYIFDLSEMPVTMNNNSERLFLKVLVGGIVSLSHILMFTDESAIHRFRQL